MSLTQTTEAATIIPKRAIGAFTATVTVEEIATDDLEITQHPVQQGATITDHAYVKPVSLSVKVMWGDEDKPLPETYSDLLTLQASRVPITVITGKRVYRNMLIKSLGQTTDIQTENVLSVTMDLQEIIITQVVVTTVPARAQQKQPGKTGATEAAGNKSAQTTEEPKKKSALATLAGK